MRAMLLTRFGGSDALEYREDVPDPVPADGEVLVRVGGTGINNTDIWTREGAYGSSDDPTATSGWRREPFVFPRIQGADIAGEVVATGGGVDPARVGERVLVDPMVYDGDERDFVENGQLLGSERDGGFADYIAVPARNALVVESSLTDVELASFPTAYSTALRMLDRVGLAPGETVLVTGASGGVGTGLVQLARIHGARVLAVVGKGKEHKVLALGAEAAIPRDADLPTAVADLTSGEGVDVVADIVGGPSFPGMLNSLRPLGRYVTAGAIAGPLVEADLRTIYLRQLQLIGSSEATHEQFVRLVEHITSEALTPLVAETFALRDLATAQEAFVRKSFFGKLVIDLRAG